MDPIAAANALSRSVAKLTFDAPVTHVYNPLVYAKGNHTAYLRRFADGPKQAVFLGMNPGPWGMAQTGIPFGEVEIVRDWLQIDEPLRAPSNQHPKREIVGLACTRSEVSGSRLWGAIREHFVEADRFFRKFFVANYCPLVFMEESGRNRTPDKLPTAERTPLFDACDLHLRRLIAHLKPRWVIGIGAFAETRARKALSDPEIRFGRILHPSPASPAANRGWASQARAQLHALGICADPPPLRK